MWYDVKPRPSFNYFNDQIGNDEDFHTSDGNQTYCVFGSRPSDGATISSSTLELCTTDPNNVIANISSVANLEVKAAHTYNIPCYPIYDRAASVYIRATNLNNISLLSSGDGIYKSSQISQGVTALGSFSTALTLGNLVATLDLEIFHTTIFCNLLTTLPHKLYENSSSGILLVQAQNRFYGGNGNNTVNSAVYTVQNGNMYEEGQSAMLDLNMFTIYTIEGQLADNNEYLLAYQKINFGTTDRAGSPFAAILANDNVGYILDHLDTTVINDMTIQTLVALASMRVRWTHNDFSDYVKTSSKVMDAVDTPVWLIIVIPLLAVVFLLPQLTRLYVRRIPQYSNDFRTILISSLLGDASRESWKGEFRAKRLDLAISGLESEESIRVASVTIDGAPISD